MEAKVIDLEAERAKREERRNAADRIIPLPSDMLAAWFAWQRDVIRIIGTIGERK